MSLLTNYIFSKNETEISYNFWLESSDWSTAATPITDESDFITFLEGQGATNVVVTNFSLVNNGALKCNVTCDDLAFLDFNFFNLTSVVVFGEVCTALTDLIFSNNQIEIFNPIKELSSVIQFLYLDNNLIEDFNPTIALPSGMVSLDLGYNLMEKFNPTLALPSSITYIFLNYNPIILTSWNTETGWISLLPAGIPFVSQVQASGTTDSIIGTTTETLLAAIDWSVSV